MVILRSPKGSASKKFDKHSAKQYDNIDFLLTEKNFASIKRMKRLVLNTEIISVYSENHTKRNNTLIGELLLM